MGQINREAKYDKYWDWIGRSNASTEFENAINMPLHMLTDEQLDELLVKVAEWTEQRAADCGGPCEECPAESMAQSRCEHCGYLNDPEYCMECRVEHHDACSMTEGCPCCDETRRQLADEQ